LTEKGKPLQVDNPQLKVLREQLQTLEKSIGDVASDSGKYGQILPKLQQLSNQLEGGYKSSLGKAAKDLEINPSVQKVKRDINWFKKEVKEVSDTYDFEKTVAEVNRFLGKMDNNYLSRKVAVLAKEIQQTKQRIRKPKSIEVLRSESFERSQRLMDELEKAEVQAKDEFRLLPPEKQEQYVSDLEQLLREKVQEANLVLRKKDQVYQLEQLLREGGDLPTQTRKPASARIEGLNSAISLMKKEIKSQKALTDDELKALQRERVKVLSEKLDNYQKQYTEGWREWKKANPQQPKSVDEVELSEGIKEIQALIRAEDNIADLRDKNRRLLAGEDISDPRKEIKKESQELRDLRVKQRRMEKALKEKIYDAENQQVERLVKSLLSKKMTTKEFWKEYRNVPPEARKRFAINVGAIPRSMLATADISAYLRQGLIALNSMAYDPSRWSELGDIVRKTLKSTFDEKTFDEIMVDIKANPFYNEAESLGTAFTDVTHDLFGREEEFVSNLVERVPVLGSVVRASNRNMAAVLNMLRMSEMQHFLAKHADESTEVKKAYASYVNASTGRGNLGDFEQASRSLAQVFFSPKFAWSRYQVVMTPLLAKNSKVRWKAIKDLSKLATTAGGILSLAHMAGYDVGIDPSDSDYGRIIVGDKRVDMLGGLQFPLRLAAYGMGYSTNELGFTNINHSYSMSSMVLNSLNYKLNPLASGIQSFISKEDWRGQEQGRFETLLRMSTPISIQEMYDSLVEDGYQPDDLLLPLNYLGGSVQDYND